MISRIDILATKTLAQMATHTQDAALEHSLVIILK